MSKSEKRNTTKQLNIRLTPEQREALEAAAVSRGTSAGSFAKRAALRAADQTPPPAVRQATPAQDELRKLRGELGRIGNNVNQLAAVANATGNLAVTEQLASVVIELRALRSALMDPDK